MSRKTFVPLYRDFGEHALRLSDPAYKCYVTLLIYADHKDGTWRGSANDLATLLGKSVPTVRRLLAELEGHYVAVEGRGDLAVTIHRYRGGQDAALTAVGNRRRKDLERTGAIIDRATNTDGISTPEVVSSRVGEWLRRVGKAVDNSPEKAK